MKPEGKAVFIRGLDPELYKKARAQALIEGLTIGQWLNKAIGAKLYRLERAIAAATAKAKKEK